jgi:DNA-binding GntR family transcriptional regulator
VPIVPQSGRTANAKSSGADVGPGRAPRLYQRAFDILAAQIANGTLLPGTRLTESEIAEQFAISRAPARRALAELERNGLAAKSAGRGYAVEGSSNTVPAPSLLTTRARMQLSSRSSWEPIYEDVEDQIIGRISFASWRVNEAKMARHYGVSRTVARDVVGRLQQRGLVLKDERSRWYAPALTPEHVGELYELRSILEPVALQKAVPNVPAEFLATMRAHLEDAAMLADAVEGRTLDLLEQEMHVKLLAHCGNRALMQAITQPQSLLIAHRFLYRWTPRLFDSEPFLPEHIAIVGHLEAGRPAKAARALESHLKVSRERALARVDAIRSQFRPDGLPYLERLEAS